MPLWLKVLLVCLVIYLALIGFLELLNIFDMQP